MDAQRINMLDLTPASKPAFWRAAVPAPMLRLFDEISPTISGAEALFNLALYCGAVDALQTIERELRGPMPKRRRRRWLRARVRFERDRDKLAAALGLCWTSAGPAMAEVRGG